MSKIVSNNGRITRKLKQRKQDRKDKVEVVLKAARNIAHAPLETNQAWLRLCRELDFMVQPEARMPRFNTLLNAVWIAATNEQT